MCMSSIILTARCLACVFYRLTYLTSTISVILAIKLQVSSVKLTQKHIIYIFKVSLDSCIFATLCSKIINNFQACRGNEENNRNSDGERWWGASALFANSFPEVRTERHPHHRIRLHAKFRHALAHVIAPGVSLIM